MTSTRTARLPARPSRPQPKPNSRRRHLLSSSPSTRCPTRTTKLSPGQPPRRPPLELAADPSLSVHPRVPDPNPHSRAQPPTALASEIPLVLTPTTDAEPVSDSFPLGQTRHHQLLLPNLADIPELARRHLRCPATSSTSDDCRDPRRNSHPPLSSSSSSSSHNPIPQPTSPPPPASCPRLLTRCSARLRPDPTTQQRLAKLPLTSSPRPDSALPAPRRLCQHPDGFSSAPTALPTP